MGLSCFIHSICLVPANKYRSVCLQRVLWMWSCKLSNHQGICPTTGRIKSKFKFTEHLRTMKEISGCGVHNYRHQRKPLRHSLEKPRELWLSLIGKEISSGMGYVTGGGSNSIHTTNAKGQILSLPKALLTAASNTPKKSSYFCFYWISSQRPSFLFILNQKPNHSSSSWIWWHALPFECSQKISPLPLRHTVPQPLIK